jgi:hypothetical protein
MQHVITLFNYAKHPPIPLLSLVIGDELEGSKPRFYTFFMPHTGLRLHQIETNMQEFKKVFLCSDDGCETSINDFKSHVAAFNLDRHTNYGVYDYAIPIRLKITDLKAGKRALAILARELVNIEPQSWQRLLANAGVVYHVIETIGVRDGYKRMPVIYSQETFTGRSKTLGFSVQGATSEHEIHSVFDEMNFQVHFDWIAADMRMAAYMSCDKRMNDSYINSDPYTRAVEYLKNSLSRDECKVRFLRAIYSLNTDESILDLYPEFKYWIKYRIGLMRKNGYLDTVLGRRFNLDGDNELSVFNSQFQGSVAHAMQAVLTQVFKFYPRNFITEMHDALIMTCSEENVGPLINTIVPIMLNPLEGYIESPPRMPVKVSVGSRWREWKHFRTFR